MGHFEVASIIQGWPHFSGVQIRGEFTVSPPPLLPPSPGVVLYECGTGKKLFAEQQSSPVALVMRIMMGSRPAFPQGIPPGYRDLAGLCWKHDPHLRPSFETAAAELAKVALTAA